MRMKSLLLVLKKRDNTAAEGARMDRAGTAE